MRHASGGDEGRKRDTQRNARPPTKTTTEDPTCVTPGRALVGNGRPLEIDGARAALVRFHVRGLRAREPTVQGACRAPLREQVDGRCLSHKVGSRRQPHHLLCRFFLGPPRQPRQRDATLSGARLAHAARDGARRRRWPCDGALPRLTRSGAHARVCKHIPCS